MESLKWFVSLVSCLMIPFTFGEEYQSQKMAVPLTDFEKNYVIDYPAQVLKAGEYFDYAGETDDYYFIYYSFEDGATHMVRVPQAYSGELLMQRKGGQVLVMKTFKFNFSHGCVLFDTRKQYPVLEDKEATLLLEIAEGIRQIEVDADRFNLKRTLVFQENSADAETDSHVGSTEISAYLESHPPVNNLRLVKDPVKGICVIETAESAGTGFLFAMDGRVYCITNHHVLGSAQELKISTADDRHFTALHFEVAEDRDLARILLKETPACFQALGTADLQESVRILGNSGGEGVVTFDEGKVVGHAPKVIEVDADFISGNSGSPILNQSDEVVGVATYVTAARTDKNDWVADNTRFVKARRFATRFTDEVDWVAVDVKRLRQADLIVKEHIKFIDEAMNLILLFASNPSQQIVDMGLGSATLRSWVWQTNALNQKLLTQQQSFRAQTQSEYEAGVKQFMIDQVNGYTLQVRRLTHLTKQQITQFNQHKRSLPAVGYYPQQIENLDDQYTLLVEGLTDLSKYLSELARGL